MAIKYAKIQPGMTLYDRHRTHMGNTTMMELGEWPVKVLELVPGGARVVWNGNAHRPEVYGIRRLERLYDWSMYDPDEAEIVRSAMLGAVIRCRRLSAAERKRRRAAAAGVVAPPAAASNGGMRPRRHRFDPISEICRNCRCRRVFVPGGGPLGGMAFRYIWADGSSETHGRDRAAPPCPGSRP